MRIREILQAFLQKVGIVESKNTVDYVCGNGEALPLPLSATEESEKLNKMMNGEDAER